MQGVGQVCVFGCLLLVDAILEDLFILKAMFLQWQWLLVIVIDVALSCLMFLVAITNLCSVL